MRLVFLYTRDRRTGIDAFRTEGLDPLFVALLAQGHVDAVHVAIDSLGGEFHGRGDRFGDYTIQVYPGCISPVRQLVGPGDVLFVRGAFKPWIEDIEACRRAGAWTMFYGANTGRERWPFWDVILDDTGECRDRVDDRGRFWAAWRKPIHPALFHPGAGGAARYDCCIGASHIHDRKGQWRGLEAAAAYAERYGANLRLVMPGALHRGTHSNRIADRAKELGLDLEMPGMLPRGRLAALLRSSRMLLHYGAGQNDRAILEAMACGTPVLYAWPQYHASWLRRGGGGGILAMADMEDPFAVARQIAEVRAYDRRRVADLFDRENGLDRIVGDAARLLAAMRSVGRPDVPALARRLEV